MAARRARRYEPESGRRTTFADVAGIDEVEDEVAEVVDFLKNPDRYRRLGAMVPKGVLLAGPPASSPPTGGDLPASGRRLRPE